MRTAAGACVLSAGLLIVSAQGAIAFAEPESSSSSGSTAESQGSESAGQGATTPSRPVTTVTRNLQESVRKTLEGVTSTIGVLGRPSQRSTPSSQPTAAPTTEPSTPAAEENNNAESSPAEPEVTALAEDSEVTPTEPTVTAPDTTPLAADPSASAAPPTPAVTNTPEPAPLAAPVGPPPPQNPVSVVVEPIAHMVGAMAYVALSGAVTVILLPTSDTPVSDVITYFQTSLSTMTDAVVPLVQLPGDLYSLLVLATNPPGSLLGAAVARDQWLTPIAGPPGLGPTPAPPTIFMPVTDIWTMPLLGDVQPRTALGTNAAMGLSQNLSVSGMAAPVSEAVSTPDAKSVLEHAVSAIVVPASLSALAAIALPGVGGLLIVIAAAMRVGYRQAKAGLAMRASGIARFAGPGPLGVVRSGSLITLHQRGSRRERPDAPRAAPALVVVEQAA